MSTTTLVLGGQLFCRVKGADGQTRTLPAAVHAAHLRANLAQAERTQADARARLRDALMARCDDHRPERQAVADANAARLAVLAEIEATEQAIAQAQHRHIQAQVAQLVESARVALADTLKPFDLTRFA